MPERFPPLEPVRGSAAAAGAGARVASGSDAKFVCVVRGMGSGSGAKTNGQVANHILDLCLPLFEQRATSMLDDLAEVWWKAEHEGARVRPFSSLPIAERADLRTRVKQLLRDRTADTLGDQAVLEGETKRLLDLPEIALRRANGDLERRAERDRHAWTVAGAAVCAIFAAGRASIAHLGDCRAVRLRRGGVYEVLTHEHVLHESDIATRAVGHWGEGPERVEVPIAKGDVFLFLTRAPLPKEALVEALREGPEAAASAVARGADGAAVVVIA